jgi:hypothetical protein
MKKLLKDEDVKKLEPPEGLLHKVKRNATHKRKHTKVDKYKEKGKNKIALRSERKIY